MTLRVFSATGGIEKVCRLAGKALFEQGAEQGLNVTVYSAYDDSGDVDENYFPAAIFIGFNGDRKRFVWQCLKRGRTATVVLLSHVNLLPVGFIIKKFSPETKLVLIAHGIEVWSPVPAWKRRLLQACDLYLPVSQFTRSKLLTIHHLSTEKLSVINNCIDPFLPPLPGKAQKDELRQRYGLTSENKLLLTVTRLSEKERAKGHAQVLLAVKELKKTAPEIRYLLAGKCTDDEKARIEQHLKELDLEEEVILPGYVPDHELPALFSLADVFIMPSQKEGFGIVFIEALYYGVPVIAGNKDGSVDALAGGRFGSLVNPDSTNEIREALLSVLKCSEAFRPDRSAVLEYFGFDVYKRALWLALAPLLGVKGEKRSKEQINLYREAVRNKSTNGTV